MSTIGKKLLTRSSIEGLLTEEKVFYVEPNMILTSSAEDLLRNRGYAIHYGVRPADCHEGVCSLKTDQKGDIEQILKNEFKIEDKAVLQELLQRIVKRL